jgi:Phage integrase, N-terminal SAM-like domain
MARPATGQVLAREGKRGVVYALRFRAYGRRRYLTTNATSRAEAEVELANVLADVRRGIWREPTPQTVVDEPRKEPTFHEFASEWLAARELEGLAKKTIVDLRWSLSNHLLPFFAGDRLSEITPQEVDRYKVGKARERQELELARAKDEKVRERGLSEQQHQPHAVRLGTSTRDGGRVRTARTEPSEREAAPIEVDPPEPSVG